MEIIEGDTFSPQALDKALDKVHTAFYLIHSMGAKEDFEELVKMGTSSEECPKCRKKAKKIMSPCTFELKGGGWYTDGYSSSSKK